MDYKASFKIEPAGQREIVMTRIFNATSDLVFDALTKPELVKRWLLGASLRDRPESGRKISLCLAK
jgi:uncharacterized protein YndB with AHSA1/START domain